MHIHVYTYIYIYIYKERYRWIDTGPAQPRACDYSSAPKREVACL